MHFLYGLGYQLAAFFLFVTALASIFYFLAVKNREYMIWSIFFAVVFAALAITFYVQQHLSATHEELSPRAAQDESNRTSQAGGVEKKPQGFRLAPEQRARFVEVLKSQTEPRESVRLGCKAGDADACEFAKKLLIMFVDAGWKPDKFDVDIVDSSRSFKGIALTRHSAPAAPGLPGDRTWVTHTPSLNTINLAFESVGLEPQVSADDHLPDGTVGVYVGEEP